MIKKYLMMGTIIISIIGSTSPSTSYAESNTSARVSTNVGITFRDNEKIKSNKPLPSTGDNSSVSITLVGLLFLLCFIIIITQREKRK
ncbi:LPXTG cell wall anchor domain-containing protein [Lactococcus garvieae]|uniref:LPXTG cell wall anchor domain-containing protein n=1 Tax=Lactococcus garvieae TaxID=1363 RepID=UPI0038544347